MLHHMREFEGWRSDIDGSRVIQADGWVYRIHPHTVIVFAVTNTGAPVSITNAGAFDRNYDEVPTSRLPEMALRCIEKLRELDWPSATEAARADSHRLDNRAHHHPTCL